MELIFKLPEGKLPFIGILFQADDYKACLLNQDLIHDYTGVEFWGSVELGSKPAFSIKSRHKDFQTRTYEVTIFPDKLSFFLSKTRKAEKYNFGHVLEVFRRHELARTARGNRNFVIPLSSFIVEPSHVSIY